jgi:hypothetical protein
MRALLLTVLALTASPALAQEKMVATNMDVRTILAFKVSDAAVQKLLPPGWTVNPGTGPSAGANLRVTFADQMAQTDAAGKPLPPVRNLIFGIPAKRDGVPAALMVFLSLSPGAGGPYGTGVKSTNTVERKITHATGQPSLSDEAWEYKSDGGQTASLQVQYLRGTPVSDKSELRVYSQLKPEFFRIYRYEQGVDVVLGADGNMDRLKKVAFKASGDKLSPLFDGSEKLISLVSYPWYQRQIYLPGS